MSKILVSGLINTETTIKVRKFPIEYFPIDYPFFGVNTRVSGVAYNVAKAMKTLGDEVRLCTMTGKDFGAEYIRHELSESGVSGENIKEVLKATPGSAVLYDEDGKRQIYCDLKDIQESEYSFAEDLIRDCDVVVACNINFNRELLKKAKDAGKIIATDVHVLNDIDDDYNRDFMESASILFLSDEGIEGDYQCFLEKIEEKYHNEIIVLGMGKKGALMYEKETQSFISLPSVHVGEVVNTVGAGDALFSAFVHFYAKGLAPAECLRRAQYFASYKIGFDGAAVGFADEATIEKLLP